MSHDGHYYRRSHARSASGRIGVIVLLGLVVTAIPAIVVNCNNHYKRLDQHYVALETEFQRLERITRLERIEASLGSEFTGAVDRLRRGWQVTVYNPAHSRGTFAQNRHVGSFQMLHHRFHLTTHRLYGVDSSRPLDYRLTTLLDPPRPGDYQLSIRLRPDLPRATIEDWPRPGVCTVEASIGTDEVLSERIELSVESDITLLSAPYALTTSVEPIDILVECSKQPEQLIRSLTIEVNVRIARQRAGPPGSLQLLTSSQI